VRQPIPRSLTLVNILVNTIPVPVNIPRLSVINVLRKKTRLLLGQVWIIQKIEIGIIKKIRETTMNSNRKIKQALTMTFIP
jgi:hypothetical protein